MKPILFSTPMVQAILEGRKTMTRRIVKPQPEIVGCGRIRWKGDIALPEELSEKYAPRRPGDILWVRETWMELPYGYVYRADDEEPEGWDCDDRWRPSIFMPKEACRIFLRVTDVRMERLQQIPGTDITREGVGNGEYFDTLADRAAFRELWDSLRKPEELTEYGWEANPYVWVIAFERCGKAEAQDG